LNIPACEAFTFSIGVGKQGKGSPHPRDQNRFSGKKFQKFGFSLPHLRTSDVPAGRQQDPPKSKEEESIFRGRVEGKRAGESVSGKDLMLQRAGSLLEKVSSIEKRTVPVRLEISFRNSLRWKYVTQPSGGRQVGLGRERQAK
jgi:hypothetical protein